MQAQIRDNKHITFHPITPRQIGALGSGPGGSLGSKDKLLTNKDKAL